MTNRTIGVFFLCLLLCSCSTQRPSQQSSRGTDSYVPYFGPWVRLNAQTDADIERFVAARAGEQVIGLSLTVGACTKTGLSFLGQLNGVIHLDLIGHDFRPVLTDDQFQGVIKIKSLTVIRVWYGVLTSSQRALLKQELPGCRIFERMNKI